MAFRGGATKGRGAVFTARDMWMGNEESRASWWGGGYRLYIHGVSKVVRISSVRGMHGS